MYPAANAQVQYGSQEVPKRKSQTRAAHQMRVSRTSILAIVGIVQAKAGSSFAVQNFDKAPESFFGATFFVFMAFFFVACGGSGSDITRTTTLTPMATPTAQSMIPALAFKILASGFTNPLGLEMPNDGSNRFFVVEQAGTIKILHLDGTIAARNFLDITAKVSSGGELGLLGVTFHPGFSTNGRFFVNYTRTVGASQFKL